MSDLLAFTLTFASADPAADAIAQAVDLVNDVVQGGAVVERTGFDAYGDDRNAVVLVRGYTADTPADRERLRSASDHLLSLPIARHIARVDVHRLAEQAWAEAWKAHFHPLRLGERLVISPTWEEPPTRPGDLIIWLDPGMAFGTGAHPSTQLILELLERHLRTGDTVLDIGTGSGILAIAALRLGAIYAFATDVDADAIEVAATNAALNQVAEGITLSVESTPTSGSFDVICANILADTIAELLTQHDLAERLAPDGVLLLSGVIAPRRELVDLALAATGLHIIETRRQDDWLAFAAQHLPPSP